MRGRSFLESAKRRHEANILRGTGSLYRFKIRIPVLGSLADFDHPSGFKLKINTTFDGKVRD
jgi:hypothetical protein